MSPTMADLNPDLTRGEFNVVEAAPTLVGSGTALPELRPKPEGTVPVPIDCGTTSTVFGAALMH